MSADAWKTRYQSVGKLGGASFSLDSYTYKGGHRVAVYKYPESNRVEYDQQGQDVFDFSLEMYIVGKAVGIQYDDYDKRRDALLAVVTKGGRVSLVHPYLGTMKVEIRNFTLKETSSESNIAKFTVAVSRDMSSGRKRNKVRPPSAQSLSDEWGRQLSDYVAVQYDAMKSNTLDPTDRQLFLQELKRNALGLKEIFLTPAQWAKDALEKLDSVLKIVDDIKAVGKELQEYKRVASSIRGAQSEILASGASLYNTLRAVVEPGYNPYGAYPMSFEQMSAVFQEYKTLVHFEFNRSDTNQEWALVEGVEIIPQPKYAPVNSVVNGMNTAIHGFALSAMCTQATLRDYDEYDEIQANEDSIVLAINSMLSNEDISTDMRNALRNLKAGTINSLEQKKESFNGLITETPTTTTAINMAQLFHDEVSEVDNIISRNKIVNPLFVDGNTTIKSRKR